MATSGSALKKCIFWPVPDLTDWGSRCSIGQRTSGTQPSTGRSRSVMSPANIDWKWMDTAVTPVTRSSISVIREVMEGLAASTRTGWSLPQITRTTIFGWRTTVPYAVEVGGTTRATGLVWRARKIITMSGRIRRYSRTAEWWLNPSDVALILCGVDTLTI